MLYQWILFGSGKTIISVINYLKELNEDVVLFCGQRNLNEKINNVIFKEVLNNSKVEYFVVDDINNCDELSHVIQNTQKRTIGISISAPWIFKHNTIEMFTGKLYNYHGAKLPKDRGGGGLSWRIMNSNKLGYYVIHQIDTGIDTGNIIFHKEYLYPADCVTPADYMKYTIDINIKQTKIFIDQLLTNHNLKEIGQPSYLSTYFPRLNTDIHGYINWNWNGKDIESFINAFDSPYKGASSFINGKIVRLKNCMFTNEDGGFHPFQQGIIYRKSNNLIFVACNDGCIIIENILDNKDNNIFDVIKLGDRIYTPSKYLDDAMQTRVSYSSNG